MNKDGKTGARRVRVAVLVNTGAFVVTTALVVAYGPKIPAFVGDQ